MRYLISNQPTEPEMWPFLFSKKIALSCSRTKRYTVPTTETFLHNKILGKYWKRPSYFKQFTLIEWLRHVDHAKTNPKPYKDGSTLVGVEFKHILYF